MERSLALNQFLRKYIDENAKKPSVIADRAGIRRDVFSRIINCKRPIYADEVPGICSAVGLSVAELFESAEGA